ncbi:MAG: hypothetical protein ACXWR1_13450 [Bdellovibrionota bacterium]
MFWILLLTFIGSPSARADSYIQVPAAVKEKWAEASQAVGEGYDSAKQRVDQVGRSEVGTELRARARAARSSSLGQAVVAAAQRLWAGVKHKGLSAVIYLDHQVHEHLLESEVGATSSEIK